LKLLNKYRYKIPKIWFYEIKGVQDVATVKEIKTAKSLTSSRSKFFWKAKKVNYKKKNIHLNYSQINFHNWTIALAYEEKTSFNPGIICCSKNF